MRKFSYIMYGAATVSLIGILLGYYNQLPVMVIAIAAGRLLQTSDKPQKKP